MANTRQLKRRINSAKNISKITSAMEMVAASKMKRAQDQALEARPYARALLNSLHKVAAHTDQSLHPLLSTHQQGEDVLVIVSTDKGLCGSLNTNLLKRAWKWQQQHPDGKIITVGKKAARFCKAVGWDVMAEFVDLPERISQGDVLPVAKLASSNFLNKSFKSVSLLYTDFINTLSQQVAVTQLLPIEQPTPEQSTNSIQPTVAAEYAFEPSARDLLGRLLPYYLENTIYQVLLEARASEHSARMVAMKNASENADELVDELKLLFNKSRQASITNELLEITTATLSLSS